MRVDRSYYEILNVDRDVDLDGLKEAKKRKTLETHPDKNPGKDTTAEFRLVIKAYQVLSNPQERASHDIEFGDQTRAQSPTAGVSIFKQPRTEIYDEYDFLYKFVFIGAAHNNMKSRVINAMTNNPLNSPKTIGVDFRFKTLQVESIGAVKVQLWDTAGQERFHKIMKSYLRGAAAIVVVVDTADEKTLSNAKSQLTSYSANGLLDDRIISLVVVDNNPALKTFGIEGLDEYFKEFPISQKIEVNLEKPDTSVLHNFLIRLITAAYKKETNLPTELLIAGSDTDGQVTEENNSKCLMM